MGTSAVCAMALLFGASRIRRLQALLGFSGLGFPLDFRAWGLGFRVSDLGLTPDPKPPNLSGIQGSKLASRSTISIVYSLRTTSTASLQ